LWSEHGQTSEFYRRILAEYGQQQTQMFAIQGICMATR